jgi:hypothetical protein
VLHLLVDVDIDRARNDGDLALQLLGDAVAGSAASRETIWTSMGAGMPKFRI